jgi:hypothetical protein
VGFRTEIIFAFERLAEELYRGDRASPSIVADRRTS